MLKNFEDKSLKPTKKKSKKGEVVLKRWSFHGEGMYKPMNVRAMTLKEATKIFNKTKIKIWEIKE